MSPIYLFTLCLFLLTAALAFWRGGLWEKAAAVVLGLAWAVTELGSFDYRNAPWAAIAADSAVFLFLLYAALQSGRRWTQAAAGFQFLVLATHYVFATNRALEQWAYVTAYYVWNIALIASLLGGVLWRPRQPTL
ncbi:hypothetical protein GCM10017620_33570 [Brevundimonas intermedia]|uniref:Uncharacterized protein n=1 Tax=Brevundimonas intermedia TaxID=74315 RepID=A0ABQ5THS8_9CAUL|nr:hypothetical protein [Brevundimonas intermedia]GLK50383.1 hypothetical protein GCM10017620_33570 [Brevundimonas intermedia]